MKITLDAFAGAIKAPHPKLLPSSVGVDSRNQKSQRGDLRPWKQPLTVATVPAGRQSIYRFGRDDPARRSGRTTRPAGEHKE